LHTNVLFCVVHRNSRFSQSRQTELLQSIEQDLSDLMNSGVAQTVPRHIVIGRLRRVRFQQLIQTTNWSCHHRLVPVYYDKTVNKIAKF